MVSTLNIHDASFDEHRPFLYSLAYRMLGSAADAEDLVQDCYLRWRGVQPGTVESPRAYLATAITRLCINHLQSARVRREEYVGPWLPEPVITGSLQDPAELAESLTLAFLVLLESLSPAERAVFLLSEVFGYEADEIAPMVDKSPANCRQILHRARTAVQAKKPRFAVNPQSIQPLLQEFGEAVYRGDVSRLISLLHADAVVLSDGGGKVAAATQPVRGADRVARFLVGVAQKGAADSHSVPAEINRQPGFLMYREGQLHSTIVFEIENDRVQTIYITVNPDKLRKIREELHAAQADKPQD